MVVKRQCSFCAGEIEPGTGMMFVKRDGTVFHFCSSSCRKQQLNLGRVGHRLKWTRAHILKRAQTATGPSALRSAPPPVAPAPPSSPSVPAAVAAEEPDVETPVETPAAPSKGGATPARGRARGSGATPSKPRPSTPSKPEASTPSPKPSAGPTETSDEEGAERSTGEGEKAAPKKPRPRKPKTPPATDEPTSA
jgi:large subunit ribosomal protein L24e